MREVVRLFRVRYRKPDGIFRLTNQMNLHEAQVARYSQPLRDQIEQLIEELENRQNYYCDLRDAEVEDGVRCRIWDSKAATIGWTLLRLRAILADSKPVSGEIDTEGRG